jgi:hypothetical protein
MSRDPEHRPHIFRYVYSVKERLVVHRKKILALILTIASIATIYTASIGMIQLQSAVQFIEQYSNLLQVLASFILVFTSTRMYKNTVKMSEKPAMVELSQFFISPLKKYLWDLTTAERFRLSSGKVDLRYLKEKVHKEYPFGLFLIAYPLRLMKELSFKISSLPSGEILWTEFRSLLEKINKNEKWDRKVAEFDRLLEELDSRIDKLEGELKELIRTYEEEIRGKYEAVEEIRREYPSFQGLLDKLVDESYAYYIRKKRNQSVGDLSWHYFDDLFNRIEQELSRDLEEINTLWVERIRYADSLLSLLKDVSSYLKKEYKLTPSEQSLQAVFEQIAQIEKDSSLL